MKGVISRVTQISTELGGARGTCGRYHYHRKPLTVIRCACMAPPGG